MKITVIGALGNIGKHLTRRLVEKGYQVTGVDNKKESAKIIRAMGAIPAVGDLDDIN